VPRGRQANSIKLATERFGLVNRAAAGLLSDPDLGQKDIPPKLWDVLGRLTKGDTMTAQHAAQFMQELPRDPMMQRQAIKNVHAQTLDAWQRGQSFLGQTVAVPTGGGTKFTGQRAFGGPVEDRGFIPNTLPPTTQSIPAGLVTTASLSGFLASPAGNIRISCRDSTATTSAIKFDQSGNSKDSTINVLRIQ
jgi:hypothetical protein